MRYKCKTQPSSFGNEDDIGISKRDNFKLKTEAISNIDKFECSEDENHTITSCRNSYSEQIDIIREKNTIIDCHNTLKELTKMLNEKASN